MKTTLSQAYPVFHYTGSLNEDHRLFFFEHGFLHLSNFLASYEVEKIKSEIVTSQQQLLAEQAEKINGVPIIKGHDCDGNPMIHRLPFSSHYSEKLASLVQSDRIAPFLSLIEEGRIGEIENDGVITNQYFNHEGSKMKQLGWHTDGARSFVNGEKVLPMINVGLHLSDCTRAQGGLRVLAGTHKQPLLKMIFGKAQGIDRRECKDEISIETKAGDLTLHYGSLWHRAAKATVTGPESYRIAVYFQIINGPFRPKDENSKSPFLHKLRKLSGL